MDIISCGDQSISHCFIQVLKAGALLLAKTKLTLYIKDLLLNKSAHSVTYYSLLVQMFYSKVCDDFKNMNMICFMF